MWSRRNGKDFLAWHIAIWQCLMEPSVVFYIFPTQLQARACLWNSITIDGRSFLSFIPEHLIYKKNEARLEIHFHNGSILALKGSSNYENMRGVNCKMAIFSEYADHDPAVWNLVIQPVLRANNGLALFLSTPKGFNHFHQICELAANDKRWYFDKKTVEDTGNMDVQEIKDDIANGIISYDNARQEYFCEFSRGRAGQIWGNELSRARLDERISYVPHEDGHLVYTSMDLGWNDEFCIIWFQVIGQTVRVIDCYNNRQKDLAHYAQIIHSKGYTYGTHFAPHDARQHSLQTGITREDKLYDLGIPVEILPTKRIIDRLEDAKSVFAKVWIDEKKCDPLLKALDNYHREWNESMQRYNDMPKHDWSSHYGDCFSYMAVAVKEGRFGGGMTQDDVNALKRKARGSTDPFEIQPLMNPNLRY